LDDRTRLNELCRIARDGDPDRTLAALFAAPSVRASLLALIAFNVELARIGEQVSEPTLGEIKLAWWREALARAAQGESTGQPVADAMGALLRAHPHLRPTLDRLIDARRFDVVVKIMPDEEALKAYIGDTAGAMFAAAAALMDAEGEAAASVARAGGFAYGLTGLMRALPIHAAQGRIDLPADWLRQLGSSPEQILAGEASEGLAALLDEFRTEARASLREALRAMRDLDRAARTAFLPLALVEPYLSALAREGRDALHEVASINPLYRLWRLATWPGQ
jgi:15-cis-phytoene synthase